jgi:hypothetical protein
MSSRKTKIDLGESSTASNGDKPKKTRFVTDFLIFSRVKQKKIRNQIFRKQIFLGYFLNLIMSCFQIFLKHRKMKSQNVLNLKLSVSLVYSSLKKDS